MNLRFIGVFLLAIFSLAACNNAAEDGGDTADNGNNGFENFYKKFHRDTAFQKAHILFPLQGIPSMADSAFFASGEQYYWTKKDWDIMQEVDFESGEFRQELMETDYLVEERVFDKHGFFALRRFYLMDGQWKLIYYSGMNQVEFKKEPAVGETEEETEEG